jgi:hypothetical protein
MQSAPSPSQLNWSEGLHCPPSRGRQRPLEHKLLKQSVSSRQSSSTSDSEPTSLQMGGVSRTSQAYFLVASKHPTLA